MSPEQARSFCADRCDAETISRFAEFVDMLASENERQNLVSSASLADAWTRHIADSLQLLDHVSRETSPWLDMGTGAGFPGLVIALARPELEVVLVESRKRRVEWLEEVCARFSLSKCRVVGSRLETIESFPAGVISARAFAPLAKLLRLSARFSTPTTTWLLPKGRSAAQELQEQSQAIQAMFHVEQSATDPEAAIIIGHGRPPES
ncbi:16S rRNA (guanine(527)-N(7))-methyltransferase RsmG [Aurantiacibacter xanthus]|uniref:Ribosomal RNA small subunit methyltransferase G n=1 Tax=Aurantiacibacter xanthus TaxID=1784712 RepID=A0A3A1PFD7_9SPHN|nr:16S rRNA (guanine(527)-N(7))-methyltransferase RsmG [Aurantiacibacter xanthus]RIV92306.1 16S rRNA (guanine(527)-N(7))-methyltransferase RsmG [Aurantiacibacter xanthus]